MWLDRFSSFWWPTRLWSHAINTSTAFFSSKWSIDSDVMLSPCLPNGRRHVTAPWGIATVTTACLPSTEHRSRMQQIFASNLQPVNCTRPSPASLFQHNVHLSSVPVGAQAFGRASAHFFDVAPNPCARPLSSSSESKRTHDFLSTPPATRHSHPPCLHCCYFIALRASSSERISTAACLVRLTALNAACHYFSRFWPASRLHLVRKPPRPAPAITQLTPLANITSLLQESLT